MHYARCASRSLADLDHIIFLWNIKTFFLWNIKNPEMKDLHIEFKDSTGLNYIMFAHNSNL